MRNFTKNIKMKTIKNIALIIFLLLSITINAQNNIDTTKFKNYCNHERCKDYNDKYHLNPFYNGHLCENFNPEQIDFSKEYYELQTKRYQNNENILNQLIKYDFSKIWFSRNQEHNGIIGKNYQRIQIHIDTVYKNTYDDKNYIVIGKSKVKDNICSFKGDIKIISIFIDKDCDYEDFSNCGDLFASYTFYEDSTQYHSGIFKGITECSIYVDNKNKKVILDDLSDGADGYWNRSFVGTWTNYSKTLQKKCIWGDYRLPFTFDFDCGDGEMHINDKYANNGWKTFNDGTEIVNVANDLWETKDKWWLKK